jgi:hypothetical protein
MVNAYLLEATDCLVLIDAGWPGKTDAIFQAVHEEKPAPDQRKRRKAKLIPSYRL